VSRSVTGIVLAAGQGKRLKSDFPKVLHPAAGRPLIAHVLDSLSQVELRDRVIVTSTQQEAISDAVVSCGYPEGVRYVVQDPPAGTGDATRVALDSLDVSDLDVLVVPGDHPLIARRTLHALIRIHQENDAAATVLTAHVKNPAGYGRVIRRPDGQVERIVEERDADEYQRSINEVNAGIYIFDAAKLAAALEKTGRTNAQNEYYLTDVIEVFRADDEEVIAHLTDSPGDEIGVNSRAQLSRVGELIRQRTCEKWLDEGVSIVDISTTYIDATVDIGKDTTIHPFTFLEGNTTIGPRAQIGPQARIVDTEIGEEAVVSFAVVKGSRIGPQTSVGPFASIRPGTVLERGAKVGTFVETKQTTLGEDSKANHLAYLGDADIGRGVNIGAGSITCNWDGREKHKTVIEDEAYIGSDTMMVAPVKIGKRAATGAGSVVRGEVPDEALAVGVPARVLEGKGNRMAQGTDDEDVQQGE
jgi:bifunctional UDP-N-acetylglucosamine pyrophosphorylase / glucosamine-1-phosphate N-acetyltransferase